MGQTQSRVAELHGKTPKAMCTCLDFNRQFSSGAMFKGERIFVVR